MIRTRRLNLLASSLVLLVVMAISPTSRADDSVASNSKSSASPTKLKGLLITGGCCHDYHTQTIILTEGISQRASISWDVVHEGDPNDRSYKISIYNNPEWSKGYDVVVHNECFGSVEDAKFIEQIVKGHTETGVPAVVLHCSMHAYRAAPTDEWRKLLGVTTRRHEKGGRELDVRPVPDKHPIMTSFPAEWKTPGDELYVIENVWPACKPLATARSVDTNEDHVVIWTNTYGKARVFGTTLGHNNLTMSAEPWLDAVARGVLWSVGKLNDDGSPAEGFAGTGKAPFSFEAGRKKGEPTEAKR